MGARVLWIDCCNRTAVRHYGQSGYRVASKIKAVQKGKGELITARLFSFSSRILSYPPVNFFFLFLM